MECDNEVDDDDDGDEACAVVSSGLGAVHFLLFTAAEGRDGSLKSLSTSMVPYSTACSPVARRDPAESADQDARGKYSACVSVLVCKSNTKLWNHLECGARHGTVKFPTPER